MNIIDKKHHLDVTITQTHQIRSTQTHTKSKEGGKGEERRIRCEAVHRKIKTRKQQEIENIWRLNSYNAETNAHSKRQHTEQDIEDSIQTKHTTNTNKAT